MPRRRLRLQGYGKRLVLRGYGRKRHQRGRGKKFNAFKRGVKTAWNKTRGVRKTIGKIAKDTGKMILQDIKARPEHYLKAVPGGKKIGRAIDYYKELEARQYVQ